MDRAIFPKGKQKEFLHSIKKISGFSNAKIGKLFNRSSRTVCGWYNEESTIPYNYVVFLCKKFNFLLPKDINKKPKYWYVKEAGKMGGLAVIKKYGNPGTKNGRRLGGMRSVATHKKLGTNFKQRKTINKPNRSKELAEFIGIMLGDGSLAYHQVGITLNNLVDKEYGNWICDLIFKLFNVQTKKSVRNINTLQLTVSGVNLVEFLIKQGLLRGDKIKNKTNIPNWILSNKNYRKACVRGLIDTDGCVYIDIHKNKKKTYRNICLDFTSANPILLQEVHNILKEEGYEFKRYFKSIKLRRENMIKKYFLDIGTHNLKHKNKYLKFFKDKYGEVA